MSFSRWDYQFDGPYTSPERLMSQAGVYVIWCELNDELKVLDVGESEDVKDRVINHDRSFFWRYNCSGAIIYSAT